MTFNSDLDYGKQYEYEFAKKLMDRGNAIEVKVIEGKNDFDVVATYPNNKSLTFEVKSDREYKKTGNIAVQVGQSGNPTNIARASVDHIVYHLDGEWYSQRALIVSWLLSFYKPVNIGDGKRASCVLLNKEEFDKIFDKINY